MASTYTGPIRGLHVKHGFFKSVHKGEDTWSQKPGMKVPAAAGSKDGVPVTLDFFGIYDGHGGKQAATYASRHLPDKLLEVVPTASQREAGVGKAEPPPELQSCKKLSEEDWMVWEQQEALVSGLPEALVEAFQKLQSDFFETTKESGTTATVAVLAGWELVVANVGDSCAFLDTGSEVLQVSGNHRLDDSKSEQERIKAAGFEVSTSTVEGKPCGPLRVWPGGLAMSRTLGDFEAGEVVLSEPEVRQVTLPASGGRVIIASDGLWDAVAPKTAAHHVRGMSANKAARELVQAALKAKGLRDDITVLVIDALPDKEQKLPPQLAKDGGGHLQAHATPVHPVNVYHPLEDGEVGKAAWHRLLWDRRLESVQAAFPDCFRSEEELRMMDSGCFSAESCGTVMAMSEALTGGADDDSASDAGSASSEASVTAAPALGNNPFAMAGEEQFDAGEVVFEETWETVPTKSRAVPTRAKKHALPASEGSPSESGQVPKALKEAPPSPFPSPMLSSDLGSVNSDAGGLQSKEPTQRGYGDARRGRGRRSNGGRGRSQRPSREAGTPAQHEASYGAGSAAPGPALQHINGFQIRRDQPMAQTKPPPAAVSFLEGGGFSVHVDAAPMFAGPPEAAAGRGPAVIEFTPAARGAANAPPARPQRNRVRQPRAVPAADAAAEGGGTVERPPGAQPRGRNRYRPRKPVAEKAQAGDQAVPKPDAAGPQRGRGPRRNGRGQGSGFRPHGVREAAPVENM